MKTLFIHIGTHKTGTTSTQEFLRINAQILINHNLYIPQSGTLSKDTGHHNIAWELRSDSRYRESYGNLESLVDELKKITASKALISSEDFEYLINKENALNKIETQLATINWNVVYILSLRNQYDYLSSLHNELSRHEYKVNYIKFASKIIINGKYCCKDGWCFYFNYYDLIERLKSESNSRFIILSYDLSKSKDSVGYDIIYNIIASSISEKLIPPKKLHVTSHNNSNLINKIVGKIVYLRFMPSNLLIFAKYGVKIKSY